jgi:mRNA interferase RelE/StbE
MAEYTVRFKPSADKALRKLPEMVQKRIVAAVEGLQSNPRPSGCVKLEGEDALWRIRVGDYRVVYHIRDKELIVVVVRIAHRKDVYKGM